MIIFICLLLLLVVLFLLYQSQLSIISQERRDIDNRMSTYLQKFYYRYCIFFGSHEADKEDYYISDVTIFNGVSQVN